MFKFYRKESNYSQVFELFFSIINDLGKNNKELEIHKLDSFLTPSSQDKIIPLLHNLYSDHYAVAESVSFILNIKNFSDFTVSNLEKIIISKDYLIHENIIFFVNPLSEEAQSVIKSINDYDTSEILFSEYGIIHADQISEIKNKIDNEFKSKKVDLNNLSVSKIFQDLLQDAIKMKASKIKIFTEDNFVKAQLMVLDDFISKSEVFISNIHNFDTIREILRSQFQKNSLTWKYFTSYYKVIYHEDSTKNIYLNVFNLSEVPHDFDDFKLSYKDKLILKKSLNSPSGVVIISGNPNSGKRTSFYSSLNYIKEKRNGLNILTHENYIKSLLSNMVQVDYNEVEKLKNIVSNYNVIGIVSNSTSSINEAFDLASNGKLVVLVIDSSSIYNTMNKIYESINSKTLITENLLCILHTALVKKVCPNCSIEMPFNKHPDMHIFSSLENSPSITETIRFENIEGCDDCFNGYVSQIQLVEIVENDDVLKDLFLNKYNLKNFKIEKRSKSWQSLFESSMKLLKTSETSLNSIIQSIGYYKK